MYPPRGISQHGTDESVPQPVYKGLSARFATVDQAEVGALSREGMSHPLSEPLQPGIRFFRHPIPAQPTASLAVRLPVQLLQAAIRAYHVP
jgi:hypothetical protein